MERKFVAARLPIGTDRASIDKIMSILNEEYRGKIECKLEKNKVLFVHYDHDLPVGDLVTIGIYIGRNIIVKS